MSHNREQYKLFKEKIAFHFVKRIVVCFYCSGSTKIEGTGHEICLNLKQK